MRSLEFVVRFHTAFRVGSTYARDGVDAALDRHDPLPADHLKGLMLAAAVDLLGRKEAEGVFGSAAQPCAWSWTSAHVDDPEGWRFDHRHRVKIDEKTHSASKDQLVLGEQAFAPTARFTVHRVRHLDSADESWQVLVLRASASAVHGIGAWRRRGLGWVGIEPAAGQVTAADVATLLTRTANTSGSST
ncbi:MAG TPA: hypothetical protein VLJ59_00410 [Mycobacteriales bacterium]|nr:hypothetical protein [Mycobacteriales bacterium]